LATFDRAGWERVLARERQQVREDEETRTRLVADYAAAVLARFQPAKDRIREPVRARVLDVVSRTLRNHCLCAAYSSG
jgi:hypothetical protein